MQPGPVGADSAHTGRMSEGNHEHHHHPHPTGPVAPHAQRQPYWKRAHKDWKFWVGAVCIALALIIYVTTLDLSSVPRPQR
jgi:hypothetical protein